MLCVKVWSGNKVNTYMYALGNDLATGRKKLEMYLETALPFSYFG